MFITHITKEGERWDTIAWHYYRDVTKMSLLIESNPCVPIGDLLPAGLMLLVPIVERPESSFEELPPWKR